MTNPRTIVFFVAFLRQFVKAAAGHVGLQVALLGVVFGTLVVFSDSICALAASRARDWFASEPQRLTRSERPPGAMMGTLGATMLTQD